jgi:O-antigen ligase
VFLGLELVPLLAFTLALVVGGLRIGSADLRRAGALILLASAGHVALGFYSYVTNRIRTGGIYFTPFTGLVALLAFDLALREPRRGVRILYVTITSLCLMHQIISLTRGYWMGLLAGLPLSVALFLLSKSAPAGGWKRVASTSLSVVGVGLLTTIAVSGWFGWGDILALLGTRFASSFGTQQSSETASNVTRLVEWLQAGREILASPWTGQGLGYELHVRHPIFLRTSSQWYVHQMYLWIWLKQGVFGLLALLAAFGAALAMGIRGARTLRGESAAWCATAASSTLYIAALGLTNYPIALVNSTFLLVVLWGIALSLQLPARYRFRWSERTASPDHRQAPVPVRES